MTDSTAPVPPTVGDRPRGSQAGGASPRSGSASGADREVARCQPTAADGIVVVDKPAGWTSHDVVGRMRRLAGTRKVGHAGTLDPMATGVLVLGVGRATRLLTYVTGADKAYAATIRLGITTSTDDAEGEVRETVDAGDLSDERITEGIAALTGAIQQVPSAVSAIKIGGRRAYALARAGEDVELSARPVEISRFDTSEIRRATVGTVTVVDVDVEVECSSGTYIRALARDLGEGLAVGGHLTALRRTRVGGYRLAQASTLEELATQTDRAGALATVPLADAARAIFAVRDLDPAQSRALSFGQWIEPSEVPGTVAAISPSGDLVALLTDERRNGRVLAKPVVVFAPA